MDSIPSGSVVPLAMFVKENRKGTSQLHWISQGETCVINLGKYKHTKSLGGSFLEKDLRTPPIKN